MDGKKNEKLIEKIRMLRPIDNGTDIAELVRCFMQTEADNDKFPTVSKRMKYLKHLEGELEKMCKIM